MQHAENNSIANATRKKKCFMKGVENVFTVSYNIKHTIAIFVTLLKKISHSNLAVYHVQIDQSDQGKI